MHTLYVVLISACKKHPQKFTLHTQTCSLNQKMQHILIWSIKVNYKKKVTCSPVAFTACLSTWQKPFFDFRKKIMVFLINHFTHTEVNQNWIRPASCEHGSDYYNKTAFATKQSCMSKWCIFRRPRPQLSCKKYLRSGGSLSDKNHADKIMLLFERNSNSLFWSIHALLTLWIVN